ncbi:NADH-quinone oxidoreductase subunit N [Rhabdothermincola sediminis]|uniref:NADH-quinone oxidoreductase subunit N n=1 Tax=Rhabdothermincola sediminis TaxID=2751370 RepID=UPI001AA0329E|nr:NADH-quinone oxidoreductase subunit N [Rhabdothermincola sediminis]
MSALGGLLAQGEGLLAPLTAGAGSAAGPAPGPVPTPSIEWWAILPLLILGVGALVLVTVTSLLKGRLFRGFPALYTVLVAVAAMIAALPVWARVQGWSELGWIEFEHRDGVGAFSTLGGMVGVDGFGIFVTIVIAAAVVLAALFADHYLRREELEGPEFYVLMLLSAFGGVIMAMANDLIVLFLGLETLSIAVYVMTAMHLRRAQSQEAGFKYFVLGAFSSAFFLYGIALLYGATGSTNFIEIKNFLAANVVLRNGLLLLGMAMLLVGLAFKIAAVPFHTWSPDAYDGAPTAAVVYMAAAVKAAAFAGIARVFVLTLSTQINDWRPLIYGLAVLSMVGGSLFAIVQSNVKRMLAYSSINHAGFILVAVSAGTALGMQAVLFYLAAYTFMVAGSFGVATLVGRRGDDRHRLTDYRGLSRTNPLLSLIFTIFLLAQAGVPFTAGFFAKFSAITAAVDARETWLAIVAMLTAVIAAFLYLRIVVAMYMSGGEHGDQHEGAPRAGRVKVPFSAALGLALCFAVTMAAGIAPSPLYDAAGKASLQVVEEPASGQSVPVAGSAGTGVPEAPTGP